MAKKKTVKLLSMLLATAFVPSGAAFGFQDSQTRAAEGASKSPRAAAIERRQPPARNGKQQQGPLPPQPWETMTNNRVKEVGAVDGGVSADMLAIRGKEFDIMAIEAIGALDVEGLRKLYEAGVTPAFDNTFVCEAGAYERLPRSHAGAVVPDRRIVATEPFVPVPNRQPYTFLRWLPTSCAKLHMEYAASRFEGSQAPRSPLMAATDKAAPARARDDARWREIVALIDANTPAADKYLYPYYAAWRIEHGDYQAALWFFRKWKEALPDIRSARDMMHPGRELLHKKNGLEGSPPSLWTHPNRKVGMDLRHWRPHRDDAEAPALLARQLAFELAGRVDSDQGGEYGDYGVCAAWKYAKAGVPGRGGETFKQRIPVEALDAMNRFVRWRMSELRDLSAPRSVEEIDGETLSRWIREPEGNRGAPLRLIAASPKADMLLLMRELLEFPGAKGLFLSFQDGKGNGILHSLAHAGPSPGSALVTRWLLEMGASSRLMNKAGDTPLSLAGSKSPNRRGGRVAADDEPSNILKDAYLLKDYPEEFLCAEEVGDPGRK